MEFTSYAINQLNSLRCWCFFFLVLQYLILVCSVVFDEGFVFSGCSLAGAEYTDVLTSIFKLFFAYGSGKLFSALRKNDVPRPSKKWLNGENAKSIEKELCVHWWNASIVISPIELWKFPRLQQGTEFSRLHFKIGSRVREVQKWNFRCFRWKISPRMERLTAAIHL